MRPPASKSLGVDDRLARSPSVPDIGTSLNVDLSISYPAF